MASATLDGLLKAATKSETTARFMSHVEYDDPWTECWTWTGNIGTGGYGRFQVEGRRMRVPAFMMALVGRPLPPGLVPDHLCVNPPCCNPDHLEAVTHQVNILRGDSPIALNARKTHCPKGHALSGDNLFVKVDGRRTCLHCRRERDREDKRRLLKSEEYRERNRERSRVWRERRALAAIEGG